MTNQQPHPFLPRSSPDLTYGDSASLGFGNGEPKVIYSAKKLQNMNCILQPTQSQGGIYLGDVVSTIKQDLIRQYKIRAIMTCMSQNVSITSKVAFHKIIPIKDLYDYPIINHFDESIQWLVQKRNQKINILVHCHAGVSRSATVVIAYLIRMNGWSPVEALQFVKQKRERVKPNASFWAQLNHYYEYWRNQNQKLGKIVPLQKQQAPTVQRLQQHHKTHSQNVSTDNINPNAQKANQRGQSKSIQKILQKRKVIETIKIQPQQVKSTKDKVSMSQSLQIENKRQMENKQIINRDPFISNQYYITAKNNQKTNNHVNSMVILNNTVKTERTFDQNRPSNQSRTQARVQHLQQKITNQNPYFQFHPTNIAYQKPSFVIPNGIQSSPFLGTFSGFAPRRP